MFKDFIRGRKFNQCDKNRCKKVGDKRKLEKRETKRNSGCIGFSVICL